MSRIFSGVQPSGIVHLGNYLGAIKQWVELQDGNNAIYCIVDLHALTMPQDPKTLTQNIFRVAATYLACSVDADKSTIFVQSHRPEHSELAWILSTFANFGQMQRMTQFKDKSAKFSSDNIPLGLFSYPTLMAADILLYQTDIVPVGHDQKQHVELTRDIAQRFNSRFGETFKVPEAYIPETGARIMGLDDPTKKMSKSAASEYNYIALTDDADTIVRKVSRAVTDSGSEIKSGADKPAITNLLNIFSLLTNTSVQDLENRYQGKTYAEFKKDLSAVIIEKVTPIGNKIKELEKDTNILKSILENGASKIEPIAKETIGHVRDKIGLV